MSGWIGVDFDGTLAQYDQWRGVDHLGEPVPAMLKRVKDWVADGVEVRIVTARASGTDGPASIRLIQRWCLKHVGIVLPVTCCKDYGMIELWDDRCVQVEKNTGRPICEPKVIR